MLASGFAWSLAFVARPASVPVTQPLVTPSGHLAVTMQGGPNYFETDGQGRRVASQARRQRKLQEQAEKEPADKSIVILVGGTFFFSLFAGLVGAFFFYSN